MYKKHNNYKHINFITMHIAEEYQK